MNDNHYRIVYKRAVCISEQAAFFIFSGFTVSCCFPPAVSIIANRRNPSIENTWNVISYNGNSTPIFLLKRKLCSFHVDISGKDDNITVTEVHDLIVV